MPENHGKCIMHMKRLLCMPRPDRSVRRLATHSHTAYYVIGFGSSRKREESSLLIFWKKHLISDPQRGKER